MQNNEDYKREPVTKSYRVTDLIEGRWRCVWGSGPGLRWVPGTENDSFSLLPEKIWGGTGKTRNGEHVDGKPLPSLNLRPDLKTELTNTFFLNDFLPFFFKRSLNLLKDPLFSENLFNFSNNDTSRMLLYQPV